MMQVFSVRTVRRLAVAAASVVLLSAGLTGCAGSSDDSSSDDYCSVLKKSKDSFSALALDQLTEKDFASSQETIDELQDAASGTIADDWAKLADALKRLQSAVEDAGLKLSDVPGLIQGNLPNGVDPTQAQELVRELQQIGQDQDLSAAANEIAADAQTTCDVTLQ